MTKSRNDATLAKTSDALIAFGVMSILRLPSDEKELRRLRALVEDRIERFVKGRLSVKDRALWEAGSAKWSGADSRRLLGVLDNVIIELAQSFGWRILESVIVRHRIQRWYEGHEKGVERLKRLFDSITLSARVARGEAKLPMTEREMYRTKKDAVPELRLLFEQYRGVFNQRRTVPSYIDVRAWFREAVAKSAASLPFLMRNIEPLCRYLDYLSTEDETRARRIALGAARPAEFFDAWAAWGRNLSPQAFRQAVSALKSCK